MSLSQVELSEELPPGHKSIVTTPLYLLQDTLADLSPRPLDPGSPVLSNIYGASARSIPSHPTVTVILCTCSALSSKILPTETVSPSSEGLVAQGTPYFFLQL